jgi:uncharacterized protein (TIGR02266 family)
MRPGALRWLRPQISERPSDLTPYTASGEANDNGQRFAGVSLDIWEGGLFVATSTPIPVGTRLMVCFELPDGTPVEANGVVRWVHTDAVNGERPGIGIALIDRGRVRQ